jgi:D-serine deaminase-like pyridoxal phosphate-dependent protein
MNSWPAARPGDRLADIDTPALILDLDAFERNLRQMAALTGNAGVRLRPHAKSHKCPEIALRQIALGAVGICCQKVSEAVPFIDAGVKDVLITNQIVGERKLHHLALLAKRARVGVLVDDARQVDALAHAAQAAGAAIDIYIEVEVGAGRCGVAAGEPCSELARRIVACPPLRFAGLHCYYGSAQHFRQPQQRREGIARAGELAMQSRRAIEACGIAVPVITGAGTGTFMHERDSGVWNELQPGSYVFMDRDYADNLRDADEPRFEHALFVKTTVMSRPSDDRAVVDAGLKASSVDSGMPAVWQRNGVRYLKASDEHGVLATEDGAAVALGDQLLLVPGHCDPTVNLYDELICMRNGMVEAVWPVSARGCSL